MSTVKYCPRCSSTLTMRPEGGRERPTCLTEGCGYFHFGDSSIGCGAVVMRGDRALMIQRGLNPGRGTWQIPGGYVEVDETIHNAVEREVLEEAGIVARATEVLGFRHAAGQPDRPFANIYVVFRLEPVSGEPRFDGDETMGAGYFTLDEMADMEGVQSLSLWAIRLAIATPPGSGLALDAVSQAALRPGSSLFGVPSAPA
jgi:ADP-ribose pyrophosphatase YjhB (NUDIX family)